jgi:hypothetical protein
LLIALGGTFGLQHAHADIYTWVDASGSINVSNLTPPDGARVTSIMRASAPPVTGDETARAAAIEAKTQALEDRVRQLENEVELSRREVPPAEYRPVPVPPVVQYIVEPPPVFVQYAVSAPPPANNWCDATSLNCGFAWTPGFYPVSVVVLRAPTFHRVRPAPGGHNFGTHSPIRTSLVTPLAGPLVPPPLRPPNSFRRG